MKKIENTILLENKVNDKFNEVLNYLDEKELELDIYFVEPKTNSPQGTYSYSDGDKYHYVEKEKGKVISHRITEDIEEIIYWILNLVFRRYSFIYEQKNRIDGIDVRRTAFDKQLEIHKILGKYYYNRKKEDIDKILNEHPYNDK